MVKKKPPEQGTRSTERDISDLFGVSPEQVRDRALSALRQKRFNLVEELLESEDLESHALVENLRVYQAELEIQNDELLRSQRESQTALARFASFFNGLPVAELVIDHQGLVKESNPAAQRLFNLRNIQFHQHFFARLIDEPQRGRVIGAWSNLAAGRPVALTEIRFLGGEAGEFIGDLHIAPLSVSEGETPQFVCAVIDRTDAIRQRLALYETSERLRRSEAELKDRLKELAALHDVLAETSRAEAPLDQVLTRVVERLPAAWRFPELAEARIDLPGVRFETQGFALTPWVQLAAIPLAEETEGTLRVAYRAQPPDTEETGPFLDEEQALLDAVATHVAVFLARCRDEERLRESREHYRILAEYSPDWEYWLGPEGHYLYVSPACAKLTGYQAKEFLADAKLLRQLIHPDDRGRWNRHLEEQLSNQVEDLNCLEFRIRTRDGEERWVEHVCNPVVAEDGRHLGRRGVNRDITDRKRAEALASRLSNLYNTLSNCSQAIVRFDDQDRLLQEICRIAVDFSGIRVCAITLEPAVGEAQALVAAHGVDAAVAQRLIAETASTPAAALCLVDRPQHPSEVWSQEVETGPAPATSRVGLRARATYPLLRGGRAVGAMHFFAQEPGFFAPDVERLLGEMSADVSFALETFAQDLARHRAEAAVQERERHLLAVLKAAQVGIGVSDRGTIREVNDHLCKLLGYDRAELIGLGTHRLAGEDRTSSSPEYGVDASQRSTDGAVEGCWRHKDGRPLDVLLSSAPLDPVCPERGLVFTALDMTERKRFEQELRRSADFLNATGRLAKVGGWELDAATDRLLWTRETYELFALRSDEAAPGLAAWLDHFHPKDRLEFEQANQRARAHGEAYDMQLRLNAAGEKQRWVQVTCEPVQQAGRVVKLVGAVQDVTSRREADKSLRQAARVFESTAEGVVITDPQERILAVNRAFTEITGYDEDEVLGSTPRILKSDRHDADFYRRMWAELTQTGLWRGEIWNRHKNGDVYPELITVSAVVDSAGELTHYVGVFRDISHIKRSEEKLEYLAHHDVLTGLPNRSLFHARLEQCLQRAARYHRQVALLFLDLDRFKVVNDTLGHPTGDTLLQQVAAVLAKQVRSVDTIARLGGDEFVIILEDIPEARFAASFADRILDTFKRPFNVKGRELFVTASIGISLYPRDGKEIDTLVRHADIAMYQAKGHGRNGFSFFEPAMSEGATERLSLEHELRGAVQRRELFVRYQPQLALQGRDLCGVEALCRWRHPRLGPIPPSQFIPLAEEVGLIDELGAWVLEQGCQQLVAWDRAGFRVPRLAVNLSMREIERADLVGEVQDTLQRTGVAPERLELEVTESMIMRRAETAIATLEALRGLGVTLAVDDFGTGYSSLGYLKRLPLNRLKIDRTFVERLTQDPNDDAIVRAVIALGRSLGLDLIAEGVETQAQLDFLLREGCVEGQGYLFSQPLAAEDLAAAWSPSA